MELPLRTETTIAKRESYRAAFPHPLFPGGLTSASISRTGPSFASFLQNVFEVAEMKGLTVAECEYILTYSFESDAFLKNLLFYDFF